MSGGNSIRRFVVSRQKDEHTAQTMFGNK